MIVYWHHVNINKGSNLSQEVFKPCKQWRIVDCPFRMFGWIPLWDGQTVSRGQPVAVHLEIGWKAVKTERDNCLMITIMDVYEGWNRTSEIGNLLTRMAIAVTSHTLWQRVMNLSFLNKKYVVKRSMQNPWSERYVKSDRMY